MDKEKDFTESTKILKNVTPQRQSNKVRSIMVFYLKSNSHLQCHKDMQSPDRVHFRATEKLTLTKRYLSLWICFKTYNIDVYYQRQASFIATTNLEFLRHA